MRAIEPTTAQITAPAAAAARVPNGRRGPRHVVQPSPHHQRAQQAGKVSASASAHARAAWSHPQLSTCRAHRRGPFSRHGLAGDVVSAAAAPVAACDSSGATEAASVVLQAACIAALLAAVHRVSFSVLAIPLQQQFGFTSQQMGMLHSVLLVGYFVGQLPFGLASDRLGGARVLLSALLFWSGACALTSLAPASPSPFAFLLAVRAALGLAQSALMPAVSALAARWFQPHRRARGTAAVYACFSAGSVAGLTLTPALAAPLGWAGAFAALGLAGACAAVVLLARLPAEGGCPAEQQLAERVMPQLTPRQQPQQQQQQERAAPSGPTAGTRVPGMGSPGWLPRLALLCFAHSVIGATFFVCQAWIPTFLHASLGVENLSLVGLLSSLPWLAAAGVSVVAGSLADWLQTAQRWPAVRVRRVMQAAAFAGVAAALLPLAAGSALAPGAALLALTAGVALTGLNYSGFHSHVQDVAPSQAGVILGITNTCGGLTGVAANLVAGQLAAAGPDGFAMVFGLAAALSAVGAVAWALGVCGELLLLPG